MTKYLTARESPRARCPRTHIRTCWTPLFRSWSDCRTRGPGPPRRFWAALREADYAESFTTVSHWLRNRPPGQVTNKRCAISYHLLPWFFAEVLEFSQIVHPRGLLDGLVWGKWIVTVNRHFQKKVRQNHFLLAFLVICKLALAAESLPCLFPELWRLSGHAFGQHLPFAVDEERKCGRT